MCKRIEKMAARAMMMLLMLGVVVPASADEFHYVNMLVGGRAADMGGAYTAISDDPAGCYYNPAGIVYGTGNALSASVNAFHHSTKTYKDALRQADGQGVDWEQTSSVLLPNFFGTVYRLKSGSIGFSYAVPDSILRKQQQRFTNLGSSLPGVTIDEYTININDVDNTYQFGPSYAVKLRDNFSIGTTIYGHYRDATVIRNQLVQLSDGRFEWSNGYQYDTEWGVRPILGIMWSPAEQFSIGLSASRTWLLSSDNRLQATIRGISIKDPANEGPYLIGDGSYDFTDPDLVFHLFADDVPEQEREYPYNVTLGFAWFPSPAVVFSTDLSYFTEVSDRQRATINVAVGAEVYLTERWALRGGLYSDRANTPEVRRSTAETIFVNQNEHIDLYGATLSLTRFTRASSITLGGGYAYGKGDAQVVGGSPRIQKVEQENLTVFLSAAYHF
jgi:long-chain fatty acid transport protein